MYLLLFPRQILNGLSLMNVFLECIRPEKIGEWILALEQVGKLILSMAVHPWIALIEA